MPKQEYFDQVQRTLKVNVLYRILCFNVGVMIEQMFGYRYAGIQGSKVEGSITVDVNKIRICSMLKQVNGAQFLLTLYSLNDLRKMK